MPCTCGSTSDVRANHSSCPVNKRKHQHVKNAAAGAAGGDVLTEAPVALSEWEFHDAPDAYKLDEDSACLDAVFHDHFKNDLECIQESAKRSSL